MATNFVDTFKTANEKRNTKAEAALKLLSATSETQKTFKLDQVMSLKKFKSKQIVDFDKFSGKFTEYSRYLSHTAEIVQNAIGMAEEDIIIQLRRAFQQFAPATGGSRVDDVVKSFVQETITAQVLMDLCRMLFSKFEATSTSERFLNLQDIQTTLRSYSSICTSDDTLQKFSLAMQLGNGQALKIMDPLVSLETARKEFVGLSLVNGGEPVVQIKAEVNATTSRARCSHCGKEGHLKEKCWTLYPKLKPSKSNRSGGGQPAKN